MAEDGEDWNGLQMTIFVKFSQFVKNYESFGGNCAPAPRLTAVWTRGAFHLSELAGQTGRAIDNRVLLLLIFALSNQSMYKFH